MTLLARIFSVLEYNAELIENGGFADEQFLVLFPLGHSVLLCGIVMYVVMMIKLVKKKSRPLLLSFRTCRDKPINHPGPCVGTSRCGRGLKRLWKAETVIFLKVSMVASELIQWYFSEFVLICQRFDRREMSPDLPRLCSTEKVFFFTGYKLNFLKHKKSTDLVIL